MDRIWIHFLPEIGRQITNDANNIVWKDEDILRMKKQIAEMEAVKQKAYDELCKLVASDWTEAEIANAKEEYAQYLVDKKAGH